MSLLTRSCVLLGSCLLPLLARGGEDFVDSFPRQLTWARRELSELRQRGPDDLMTASPLWAARVRMAEKRVELLEQAVAAAQAGERRQAMLLRNESVGWSSRGATLEAGAALAKFRAALVALPLDAGLVDEPARRKALDLIAQAEVIYARVGDERQEFREYPIRREAQEKLSPIRALQVVLEKMAERAKLAQEAAEENEPRIRDLYPTRLRLQDESLSIWKERVAAWRTGTEAPEDSDQRLEKLHSATWWWDNGLRAARQAVEFEGTIAAAPPAEQPLLRQIAELRWSKVRACTEDMVANPESDAGKTMGAAMRYGEGALMSVGEARRELTKRLEQTEPLKEIPFVNLVRRRLQELHQRREPLILELATPEQQQFLLGEALQDRHRPLEDMRDELGVFAEELRELFPLSQALVAQLPSWKAPEHVAKQAEWITAQLAGIEKGAAALAASAPQAVAIWRAAWEGARTRTAEVQRLLAAGQDDEAAKAALGALDLIGLALRIGALAGPAACLEDRVAKLPDKEKDEKLGEIMKGIRGDLVRALQAQQEWSRLACADASDEQMKPAWKRMVWTKRRAQMHATSFDRLGKARAASRPRTEPATRQEPGPEDF